MISGPLRWCPFCWVPLWKTPPPCHLCYLEESWVSIGGRCTVTYGLRVPTKPTQCRNRYIIYRYYMDPMILWVYVFVRDDLQMDTKQDGTETHKSWDFQKREPPLNWWTWRNDFLIIQSNLNNRTIPWISHPKSLLKMLVLFQGGLCWNHVGYIYLHACSFFNANLSYRIGYL